VKNTEDAYMAKVTWTGKTKRIFQFVGMNSAIFKDSLSFMASESIC